MIPATEALRLLKEGNQRFVSNTICVDSLASRRERAELIEHKNPLLLLLAVQIQEFL